MNTNNERHEELMMRYLEGSLSSEERAEIEELISKNEQVALDYRRLKIYSDTLDEEAGNLFCPNAFALFEYAKSNEDPDGSIAEHLERCSECHSEYEALKEGCKTERLSLQAEKAFRQLTGVIVAEGAVHGDEDIKTSRLGQIWDTIFKAPALTLGSALAAVALAVIVMYPFGQKDPEFVFSSVVWLDMNPVFMGTSKAPKEKVAIVLAFQGFEKSEFTQQQIDALYESISPSREIQKKYKTISPKETQKALKGAGPGPKGIEALLEQARERLGASLVIVNSLTKKEDEYEVKTEIWDSAKGEVTMVLDQKSSKDNLGNTLKNGIRAVLIGS